MGNIFVVLLALVATAVGAGLSRLTYARLSLFERVCVGATLGLALLAWLGLLASLIAGLNWIAILLTTVIFAAALALLWRRGLTPMAEQDTSLQRSDIIYFSLFGVLLFWLFSRVVMFEADGLHTAPANNFGDLPFHFSAITSFAYGANLPPQNPIFAGIKFTYPFLIDFLTAFFVRCGADWRVAFFVENFLLGLALVGILALLARRITGSALAARLAPVIFLFNGGLGFITFLKEFLAYAGSTGEFLLRLPHYYTMYGKLAGAPLVWGNVFTTLLIPQRSLLFGLPLVALIVLLWWEAVEARRGDGATGRRGEAKQAGQGDKETGRQGDKAQVNSEPLADDRPVAPSPRRPVAPSLPLSLSPSSRPLLAAGILAGLLPMLHAHGFFSVMVASMAMALLFWSWEWLAFFVPAGLLAAPQALYLSGTQVRSALFKLHWWWEAGEANPLLFWAVNAGVFILLLAAALLVKRLTTPQQARFYVPFLLWFIVPNVVLLAPWAWDNIKMLVYWSLVSSVFVALVLAWLFSRRGALLSVAASVLLIALTFSGALDVWRALSPIENAGLFNNAELQVAGLLRQMTPPRAVILHAPIHNSTVALSGRQSFMAYPGHLWTHGIDYAAREGQMKLIYAGGPTSTTLLNQLPIDYIIIGPRERGELKVDEAFFSTAFPLLFEYQDYRIYRVKRG